MDWELIIARGSRALMLLGATVLFVFSAAVLGLIHLSPSTRFYLGTVGVTLIVIGLPIGLLSLREN